MKRGVEGRQKRGTGRETTEERVWEGDKEEGMEGQQLKRGLEGRQQQQQKRE